MIKSKESFKKESSQTLSLSLDASGRVMSSHHSRLSHVRCNVGGRVGAAELVNYLYGE